MRLEILSNDEQAIDPSGSIARVEVRLGWGKLAQLGSSGLNQGWGECPSQILTR